MTDGADFERYELVRLRSNGKRIGKITRMDSMSGRCLIRMLDTGRYIWVLESDILKMPSQIEITFDISSIGVGDVICMPNEYACVKEIIDDVILIEYMSSNSIGQMSDATVSEGVRIIGKVCDIRGAVA
jgi:hypothetical protein